MSHGRELTAYVSHGGWTYPVRHWDDLSAFIFGDERDPRGLFRLADDRWEAWRYVEGGRPTTAPEYRFNFGSLRTFLKPYVKWYCYERLLCSEGKSWGIHRNPTYSLKRAESYIAGRGFASIDDIAPQAVFEELWAALIHHPEVAGRTHWPRAAVAYQLQSRAFWIRLGAHFGVPHVVPPAAPHTSTVPTEYAADRSKVIPGYVIKQLANKLALHRRGVELLNRHDHLRLCLLVLAICLGRRFGELLATPRGEGPDGPLSRAPARDGQSEGALWFRIRPNKGGPAAHVFVSAEWGEVVTYCVRELVSYGDEIRGGAPPEEQDLLILVSAANLTRGAAAHAPAGAALESQQIRARVPSDAQVKGLTSDSFERWLNGRKDMYACEGVLKKWGITQDGAAEGAAYYFKPNYVRHTRQSALALDPEIPLLARQYDLNHSDDAAQFAYQHRLAENHALLLQKISEGKLCGGGVKWFVEILGVNSVGFSAGSPSVMTPRWRALVQNNPLFLQLNRVPCGLCALPQGPGGCPEYLNCTGAAEGGCSCFLIDSEDAGMLSELNAKASTERHLQLESLAAGRTVQAGKHEVQALRAETLLDEAMRRASAEMVAELRRFQDEKDEEDRWGGD
jgi:hypothetical protein